MLACAFLLWDDRTPRSKARDGVGVGECFAHASASPLRWNRDAGRVAHAHR